MPDQVVRLDGTGLTCSDVRTVAYGQARVALDPAGLRRATEAHELVRKLVAERPVYGRTTGVGANRLTAVGPDPTGTDGDRVDAHGLRLLRSHAVGAGALLEPVVA